MNKNIFRGYTNPEHKPNRNGFDLSMSSQFSCKPGMLYPVDVIETIPGDHHEINYNYLMRTLPLNRTAFLKCKVYLHTYFVPYSQIWHQFPSFISQRNNPTSSNSKSFAHFPCFSLANLWEDMQEDFTSVIDTSLNLGKYHAMSAFKLQELLGYGIPFLSESSDTGLAPDYSIVGNRSPNVARIAAYQKIWYDHYRNPYYDTQVDPRYFNFDDLDCSNFATSQVENRATAGYAHPAYKLFEPRYRQWHKDLFMSLLPSTQFGNVVTIDIHDNIFNAFGTDGDSFILKNNETYTSAKLVGVKSSNSNLFVSTTNQTGSATPGSENWHFDGSRNGTSITDILALRKAEALQKWRETTLRAGQRFSNQQNAHFGVKPAFSDDDLSIYLGGTDSWLTIDDVTATADTSVGEDDFSSIVGSQRAKAISVDSPNKVVFDAKDWGIIMTMLSIVPDMPWTSHRVDRNNQLLEPFDFYTPEFENLGLEGVPADTMSTQSYFEGADNFTLDGIIGFAPRYYNYKARVDRVYGEFNKLSSVRKVRDLTDQNGDVVGAEVVSVPGSLRQFTPSRMDTISRSTGLDARDLYVNPACLDDIFVLTSDFTELSDQFFFDFHSNVKSVRPISVLGLPNY